MPSPTLAFVGCGAVADILYFPVLAKRPDLLRSLILVDPDLERAHAARERLGAAEAVADYRQVISRVHGAVVATPHHLHRSITLDFVRAGVHVLCEKPLAQTPAEVDEIVATAKAHGVHVAVNHMRRLFASFREVQRLTSTGQLGEVREIRYELGESFEWPAATGTYFGVESGGHGVLFDTGAHIVDLVCWWMGGEPELIEYADDSYGGTEAVARLTLRSGNTMAYVHLSWLSKLRNMYRVVGSRATVEGGVYEWSSYTRREAGGKARKIRTDKASRQLRHFPEMQLANFAEVAAGRGAPLVTAADVRSSVAVINACYAHRTRLAEPWHDACKRLAHAH